MSAARVGVWCLDLSRHVAGRGPDRAHTFQLFVSVYRVGFMAHGSSLSGEMKGGLACVSKLGAKPQAEGLARQTRSVDAARVCLIGVADRTEQGEGDAAAPQSFV